MGCGCGKKFTTSYVTKAPKAGQSTDARVVASAPVPPMPVAKVA